ncbi:hypothetical protein TraAM80_02010 [Trypanosoma rangeli]|uniref:Uncharacterized protein n=1 Tax=Trypanosoma rangeli TaxID=5698 RepID=A0A3R7KTZ8_TRYRA|nr:uncharacterized protein TraAM80_02010 [Trypanosoma rangeli]RNF09655.1 hypothetical protein TraAM80_02010 [Trypanosoma rangeli]|eukprot:RNF09655.1 hypothetical protein TraAM80_02010 [Trypanosoma rangeli]
MCLLLQHLAAPRPPSRQGGGSRPRRSASQNKQRQPSDTGDKMVHINCAASLTHRRPVCNHAAAVPCLCDILSQEPVINAAAGTRHAVQQAQYVSVGVTVRWPRRTPNDRRGVLVVASDAFLPQLCGHTVRR